MIEQKKRWSRKKNRAGFTLIELLLALGLIVVVMTLIGYLIQLFMNLQTGARENVEQVQVTRGILNLISDDIRGVVRFQQYDDAVLSEIMGASGQATGGSGDPTSGGTGGGAGTPPAGGSAGGSTPPPTSGGSTGATGSISDSTEPTEEEAVSIPGLYGSESSIQIDVSRVPRPDQYFAQPANPMEGKLVDVPSDLKTVTYFIQPPTEYGVKDPLQQSAVAKGYVSTTASHGGLVRRQLDRNLIAWATSKGQIEQLNRTGELLGPEIIAISFAYFDGVEWLTTWDSSQQGLPILIRIRMAVGPAFPIPGRPTIPAGSLLSTIPPIQLQQAGVKVYETQISIPGAILQNAAIVASQAASAEEDSDSGMESLGL